MALKKTIVGSIDDQILRFTAGKDTKLDMNLVVVDCIGTAAHAKMLQKISKNNPIINEKEYDQIILILKSIINKRKANKFNIRLTDQDVHMAIERILTEENSVIGKKIHTCRSRNDQVATDLRLYGKEQILLTLLEATELIKTLLRFGKKHKSIPMVGRTHMQPGMPSSLGLWATAHAESLLDDCTNLLYALDINDQCPLGSAASYGVSINIDRNYTSKLLGFSKPTHNVLYANNSRGKIEGIIASALSQVMLSLSRFSQDLLLYTMPEFNYFNIPDIFCTGSSIMPQKNNLDICELIRAKATRVKANELAIYDIVKNSPSGYNRDLQEAKQPFLECINETRACLKVLSPMIDSLSINKTNLIESFSKEIFAADEALNLVFDGIPFRDAYNKVKEKLQDIEYIDPSEAILKKDHLGAPSGLDWSYFNLRVKEVNNLTQKAKRHYEKTISVLLEIDYKIG